MTILALMDIGLIIQVMDIAGFPMNRASDHITLTVIGFILIMDGHGFPIIIGDGRHFIMADG